MNDIAETNAFDYSLVDFQTQSFLEEKALIILGIQSRSAYDVGKQLLEAQQKLSNFNSFCISVHKLNFFHEFMLTLSMLISIAIFMLLVRMLICSPLNMLPIYQADA